MKKLFHFLTHHAVRLANLSHTTSGGVRIDIRNEMEKRIYTDIFVDGDYDEAVLKLLSWPRRHENAKERFEEINVNPLNILDLGSNVMFFAFRLIQLASENSINRNFIIHCVEASDKLITDSQRRIQRSNFSKEQFQIKIHHGLVGQPEGTSVFYHFKDHGMSSVFRKNGKSQTLSFINVSEILKDSKTVDLLKCDIEGSEGDFIRNYPDVLKKTNIAIFEFHTEYCNYEDCARAIQNAGLIHNKMIRQSPHSRIELFWR